MRRIFIVYIGFIAIQGCFLAKELTGYQAIPDFSNPNIDEQIKKVVENPPQSGREWLYILVAIAVALLGYYARYKFQQWRSKEETKLARFLSSSQNSSVRM